MPITKQGLLRKDELKLYPDRFDVIDNKLQQWVNEGLYPSINAIVMRDGTEIFNGSYGTNGADGGSQALTLDTIYPMASITKPVTAALMMILSEDGEIELNDPVCKYFSEFDTDDKRGIAIWHLLTHTSGIEDEAVYRNSRQYYKDELGVELKDDNWDEVMTAARERFNLPNATDREISALINRLQKPTRRAREAMMYSTIGFDIAKDIICKVSGRTIDEFASKRLFEPLEMPDTHWILPDEKWNRVIRRPEGFEGYPWQNKENSFVHEGGGNGLKSTANDMIKFCEMMRLEGIYKDVRIMSPITVRGMVKNHNIEGFPAFDAWSLGFNYHGIKCDDMGLIRSDTTIDHGGYGGSRIFIDFENKLSWLLFTVKPLEPDSIFSKFAAMVYSGID